VFAERGGYVFVPLNNDKSDFFPMNNSRRAALVVATLQRENSRAIEFDVKNEINEKRIESEKNYFILDFYWRGSSLCTLTMR
jgi:hypothetical protein